MNHAASVDVIFPALDEEAGLARILPRLPTGYRAIVVDNGSTDKTVEVSESFGALVVSAAQRGFGAACWEGFCAATASVVAFCDADGSFDTAELPRVCDPVSRGEVDLMLGRRISSKGAWPIHARAANWYLTRIIRRRTGLDLHDLGPMRAMRRNALAELGMIDRRSGWPLEMVLRASYNDWSIREVDVSYSPRLGKSKVTGTAKGTAIAIKDMTRIFREVTDEGI